MDDHQITEAMIQYGGSFVKGLGHLYRLADHHNKKRIRATFGDYWDKYTQIAETEAQRILDER
jgi:hypothetical protein